MDKEDKILKLYNRAKKVVKLSLKENKLPSHAYFIDKDVIAVLPNKNGDMRHPYSFDGMTLWAYASGYIVLNESSFFVFPQTLEGKETNIAFFGGIKNNDHYDYFSITGASDTVFGLAIPKMAIFTPTYALYVREYKGLVFYTKISLSIDKKMIVDLGIINKTSKDKEVYLSSYINPILIHSNFESEESKWFKTSKINDRYTLLSTKEDISRDTHLYNYGLIASNVPYKQLKTAARAEYVGNKNGPINGSISLTKGEFKEVDKLSFIDQSIHGDLTKLILKGKQSICLPYSLRVSHEKFKEIPHFENNDEDFAKLLELDKKTIRNNKLKIEFEDFNDNRVDASLFNKFIHSVIRQVDYCSKAKNSSLSLLGVRDIAQMLEASLMWDKKTARKTILKVLSYIDLNGRSPRQFSSNSGNETMLMDNREFIDQGQWIISLVHKYLSYTNDKTILKEKCGYVELIGRNQARKVDVVDTVFDHLERIIDYLIKNIDPDSNCLRTLYGDWNDAVDGLGTSSLPNQEFGNGVSTMASLHLYKNLKEMSEICGLINKNCDNYLEIRERIGKGVLTNLVVTNSKGEKRLVHGYGENKSFYVGSFSDVDKKSRYSATSGAFYIISNLYKEDKSLIPSVIDSFRHLDSKYGIRTFDEYFDMKDASKVGRIVNLPKGTAENAATYIHAGMFSTKALAILNETNFVFDQIFKLIPITHENISVSSFVMPNSYGCNPDFNIDGQSMNDWYTGSSNTLLKVIVDDIFGISPQIDNKVRIKPISSIPAKRARINIEVKGHLICLSYRNENSKLRMINNQRFDEIVLNLDEIKSKIINIEVID